MPVFQPSFYDIVTPEMLSHILRSDTDGQIPLMEERWKNVKEAGDVIKEVSKRPRNAHQYTHLHYTMLYYAMLCCAMLCYAILCYHTYTFTMQN